MKMIIIIIMKLRKKKNTRLDFTFGSGGNGHELRGSPFQGASVEGFHGF